MKKILFLTTLALFLTVISFGQETKEPGTPMTKQDYLKKSKSQKTFAWILLGAGTVCFAAVAPGNTSLSTTGVIIVVGGVAVVSSIPLFIASSKNKKRAMTASASIDMQKIQGLPWQGISYAPALSLKLRL